MSSFGDKLPLELCPATDRVGEQLAQAIVPMIIELAELLYDCARGRSLGCLPEEEAVRLMLGHHLSIVMKDAVTPFGE